MLLTICSVSLLAQERTGIAIGDRAPEFSLPFATRDSVARFPLKLSDFVGQRAVLLAFYPADWSPGCTKEVCSFRDNFLDLQTFDVEVLGISGDYVWSHYAWAKHHELPFKLLSDHDHSAAKVYDSYNEKTQYNKRTIFLIDKDGVIRYRNLQYSVSDAKDFETLRGEIGKLK